MHKLIVEAVKEGRVKLAKILLEGGVDPNCETTDGESLLALAIGSQHDIHVKYQTLSYLFKHGANANKKNKNGRTVLIHAVLCSNPSDEIVSLIIQNGADLLEMDDFGLTAMDYAREMNYKNICRLIREGIDASENKNSLNLKEFIFKKVCGRRNRANIYKSSSSKLKNNELDDVFHDQADNQEFTSLTDSRKRVNIISAERPFTVLQTQGHKSYDCTISHLSNSDPLERKDRIQPSPDEDEYSEIATKSENKQLTTNFDPSTGVRSYPKKVPKLYLSDISRANNRGKQQEQHVSNVSRFQSSSPCYRQLFTSSQKRPILNDLDETEIDICIDDEMYEKKEIDDREPNSKIIGSSLKKLPKRYVEDRSRANSRGKQQEKDFSNVIRFQSSPPFYRELLDDTEIGICIDDEMYEEQEIKDRRPRSKTVGSTLGNVSKRAERVPNVNEQDVLPFHPLNKRFFFDEVRALKNKDTRSEKELNKRGMPRRRIVYAKKSHDIDSFKLPPI